MKKYSNIGVILGATITIVCLLASTNYLSFKFASLEPSAISLININLTKRIKETPYDCYIVGSSQCAQIQPKIISDITGIKTLVACAPGGDISYIYSTIKDIIKKTKTKPVIIAEFSPRYVSTKIEDLVYRDTLKYLNASDWIDSELPLIFNKKKYRKYYFDGIESSIIPCVRYKYSIKFLVNNKFPLLADLLMNSKAKATKRYSNGVAKDGHVGPYPRKPPPFFVPNKKSKVSTAISHKLSLWKKLYELHSNSNIFLIICKPAYHHSWDYHYKHKYDKKVYDLETFLITNGVPEIDCTTINIKDSDCHDAHHFTWNGAAKISELVAFRLSKILNKQNVNKEDVCLTGKKLSELN